MKRGMCGMSLVELMLALLLGTLLTTIAIGIFLANRQTMASAQGIGQIQQNMQTALELLVRDLRQAGGNPCSQHIPLANIINSSASHWWAQLSSSQTADGSWSTPWRNTLRGLTTAEFPVGTDTGSRAAEGDAIELLLADSRAVTVVSHDGSRFVLNTSEHGFSNGNLLLACDSRQASLFQATVSGANILHPSTGMNCSKHLALPGGCGAELFIHASPALITRWNPVRWYLGNNGRNGTSLYQITLDSNGQGVTRHEMVENVSALEFRYLLEGSSEYVRLPDVSGRWDEVIAVRVEIAVTARGVNTDNGEPLAHTTAQTVSIRNRNP